MADEIDLGISPLELYGPWTALDDQLHEDMETLPAMETAGRPQRGHEGG